jgi:hypothetical protein
VTNANGRQESLEEETVAAHRAYLLALLAWERTFHESICPICGSKVMSIEDHDRASVMAEAHKESCRVRFRDLVDALGYLPRGHEVVRQDERFTPGCGLPTNWWTRNASSMFARNTTGSLFVH